MRRGYLTDFGKGVIFGVLGAIILSSVILLLRHIYIKEKDLREYAEKQIEIETLRENYLNLDTSDFLEVPDVRRAADGAAAEFDRKRNEILQRFRSGLNN